MSNYHIYALSNDARLAPAQSEITIKASDGETYDRAIVRITIDERGAVEVHVNEGIVVKTAVLA